MSFLNMPNILTILRIVLVPVFVYFVLSGEMISALIVFALASITDGIDGFCARKFNQITKFGTILDPLADKLLVNTALISLSLSAVVKMPLYVPVIVFVRDVLLLSGTGLMYLLKINVEIKPRILGKLTTVFQMITIIVVLAGLKFSFVIWNITAVLTVLSLFDYLFSAVKNIQGSHAG